MEASAQTATATYDCKFGSCTNEVKSNVGRYSYCDIHRDPAARGLPAKPNQTTPARSNGGKASVSAQLDSLRALAKEVDRLNARAVKLTTDALTAKRAADVKAEELRERVRTLGS